MKIYIGMVTIDIFISYSNKDIANTKEICSILKQHQFLYWVAHENGDFGDNYATTIINQISEAKIFIVLVSKSSNISTHVINEINSAVMRDKLIIPIILDDVNLSPAMEYYLASNHYLKFFQNKDFSSQLINRVYSLLGLKKNAVSQESLTTISSENEDIFSKANNGDLPSLFEIGRRYYNGSHDLNKNLELAFEYFMKAANQNYADAQCNVAWCYEVGDGVEESLEKAYEWYEKSANNNCSMAQYSLGWMFANGIFVPKNQSKAINWFIKASENGHPMAQYKLGMAYLDGVGVDQNSIIANHWLMISADQGTIFHNIN